MARLTKLSLSGFKSIARCDELALGPLNVLIGPNGAGKSNLLSFMGLLGKLVKAGSGLQLAVARWGGANALLHDGASCTPQIEAKLWFAGEKETFHYEMTLIQAAPDTLIFAREGWEFDDGAGGFGSNTGGHRESSLERWRGFDAGARGVFDWLDRCQVYHFHNTTETARIKARWDIEDSNFLKEDAGNLAPVLYRLRERQFAHYRRIVDTIQLITPFFADFELVPDDGRILLQWRERGSDLVFGGQHASDGALRVMALVTLLLQPLEYLPSILILDEPELGLHPFAVEVVAGLLRAVSNQTQVIVATQSVTLLDHFSPEEVIVTERVGRGTTLRRLDSQSLTTWLEEYSLSELWEKNVLGGRPKR